MIVDDSDTAPVSWGERVGEELGGVESSSRGVSRPCSGERALRQLGVSLCIIPGQSGSSWVVFLPGSVIAEPLPEVMVGMGMPWKRAVRTARLEGTASPGEVLLSRWWCGGCVGGCGGD